MRCAIADLGLRGLKKLLNLKILLLDFVPRDLEWRINMRPPMAPAGTLNGGAIRGPMLRRYLRSLRIKSRTIFLSDPGLLV